MVCLSIGQNSECTLNFEDLLDKDFVDLQNGQKFLSGDERSKNLMDNEVYEMEFEPDFGQTNEEDNQYGEKVDQIKSKIKELRFKQRDLYLQVLQCKEDGQHDLAFETEQSIDNLDILIDELTASAQKAKVDFMARKFA